MNDNEIYIYELEEKLETARTEAIKEFKAKLWEKLCTRVTPSFVFNFINATEKEMVGERE